MILALALAVGLALALALVLALALALSLSLSLALALALALALDLALALALEIIPRFVQQGIDKASRAKTAVLEISRKRDLLRVRWLEMREHVVGVILRSVSTRRIHQYIQGTGTLRSTVMYSTVLYRTILVHVQKYYYTRTSTEVL